jgi:hypothetical protein
MKYVNTVLSVTIVICLTVISIVSFHSVSEIHYLKSFYPGDFSVSDAAYAAIVELVKVFLIAFPFILIMFVCLFLMWLRRQSRK